MTEVALQWGKRWTFQQIVLGQRGIYTKKQNWTLTPYHVQKSSRWIKDVSVKGKIVKLS